MVINADQHYYIYVDGLLYANSHIASNSNSLLFVIDLKGRGSVVGIATHYGLDGQGIESR
jgi:hypothetical protein